MLLQTQLNLVNLLERALQALARPHARSTKKKAPAPATQSQAEGLLGSTLLLILAVSYSPTAAWAKSACMTAWVCGKAEPVAKTCASIASDLHRTDAWQGSSTGSLCGALLLLVCRRSCSVLPSGLQVSQYRAAAQLLADQGLTGCLLDAANWLLDPDGGGERLHGLEVPMPCVMRI